MRNPIRPRNRDAVLSRESSQPSTVTRPDEGSISPASIRSVVVLPAPFGPSSAKISPGTRSNETSSTATRVPNRRVRWWAVRDTGRTSGALPAKSAARVEFVTARRHQQAAILREEEARRADDSGGGELNRTALVSLRVVHVGKRAQSARSTAVRGHRRPRRGRRVSRAAVRDPRRASSANAWAVAREIVVDLGTLDVPLVAASDAVSVVLPKHRTARQEHVEVPAGRIDERKPDVERKVKVAVLFVAGVAQPAEAAKRIAGR